ncbi:hypothetical protein AX16_010872 [Volvariella volvacea WC 439]|nr:hypothetical protein AX16_010872 [Volvariella volvacea WC 439]
MVESHLTILDNAAVRFSTRPAFKVPQLDCEGHVRNWVPITYRQFHEDVQTYAKYWARTLRANSIPQRSIIGLWLGGFSYSDVLQIYGLTRAGYIPQLFSLRLSNPDVVYELLSRSKAQALVVDPSYQSAVHGCPVPHYVALDVSQVAADGEPLPSLPQTRPDDTALVFHTSGSTSGSPKLVPCSYRWISSVVLKSEQICRPRNPARQDVTAWMGSMCHIAQNFMLIGSLQYGSSTVLPSSAMFSSEELIDMVQKCGLNRLNQFASYLGNHIRTARQDPKLLRSLASLDDVLYSGLPLSHPEEEWAYKNGIRLRNLFGSTECGGMLLSGGYERNPALLQPLAGTSYEFVPQLPGQASHQSTAQLYELVIRSDSLDCPDVSLRNPADGHFHTGDLFQEVVPGFYLSKGRDDDWIKSESSLRCDTKSIEDNIRLTCGPLVAECVVVGSGRPFPAIFIEPASNDTDSGKLKRTIFQKTKAFHTRRYLHEKLVSPEMIVVVEKNSLPRTVTKGNVRRRAVEQQYEKLLDDLYARVRKTQ